MNTALSDKEYINIWNDLRSQDETAAIAAFDKLADSPGLLPVLVNRLNEIGEKRVSTFEFTLKVEKLAKSNNPATREKLLQYLSSNDEDIKLYAALGLVDTHFVEAIQTIMPLMANGDAEMKGLFINEICLKIHRNLSDNLDFTTRLQLINFLHSACSDEHDVRRWAIDTLSSTDLLVGFERFDKLDKYFVMLLVFGYLNA